MCRNLRLSLLEFAFVLAVATGLALQVSAALAAPDPAFTKWLEGLWSQAEAMGVSRKTFTSSTHGLELHLSLPDLDLPGRGGQPPRSQAEFVQTPADYIKEATIARLAENGKKQLANL